jgi:hypothetical protein
MTMLRYGVAAAIAALWMASPVWAAEVQSAFEGSVRILPDLSKSPSAIDAPDVVRPNLKYADLCPHANTKAIRDVTLADALTTYRDYGLSPIKYVVTVNGKQETRYNFHVGPCSGPEGCEVDHICSLEIGCNNNRKNRWVQPYAGVCWTAHVKDVYEDWLHTHFLCGTAKEGNIAAKQASFSANLAQAQREIATDWITGYRSHPELPIPACAK